MQDLARADLDHPTIHAVHLLFAAEAALVNEGLLVGEQKRLDLADVVEILVRQLQVLETLLGRADKLLAALPGWREDDVAHFAVIAGDGSVIIQFFHRDALPVCVVRLRLLRGRLRGPDALDQVRGRILGACEGRKKAGC